MIKRVMLLTAMTALFAGCGGDPAVEAASQEPVELAPGMYHVDWSGLAGRTEGPGQLNDDICIRAGEGNAFPDRLAQNYFSTGTPCTPTPRARQGNAFGGAISCPMDAERAPGGSWNVDYTAVMTADAVDVSGTIHMVIPPSVTAAMPPEQAQEMRAALTQMDGMAISLRAERTGDCG
jgi:hypothetical protein